MYASELATPVDKGVQLAVSTSEVTHPRARAGLRQVLGVETNGQITLLAQQGPLRRCVAEGPRELRERVAATPVERDADRVCEARDSVIQGSTEFRIGGRVRRVG